MDNFLTARENSIFFKNYISKTGMAHQINAPLAIPESRTRSRVRILAIPLWMQHLANAPGKAMKGGPSTWTPARHGGVSGWTF